MLHSSMLKLRMTCVALALTFAILFSSPNLLPSTYAAAGDLDPSFGSGGKVTTDFAGGSDSGADVVVQPDGKIVVGGSAISGDRFVFALARYNTDGSLDTTFGSGGKVLTDFGVSSTLRGIALQSDGKIVAAGNALQSFALARYNSDGSLDSGFGSGGLVTTPSGNALDVVIQSDGKIIIAGFSLNPVTAVQEDFALLRYNGDGSLDSSFGSGGIVTTDFSGSNMFTDVATSVLLQPDGKIVAAGGASFSVGFFDFALARYNSDGSLDLTFGSGGKATSSSPFGIAGALARQADGKFILAGNTSGDPDFLLIRFNSNGSLDLTFGSGGQVTTNFGAADVARGLAIEANGKIIAVGSSASITGTGDFALARYNTDGSLDATFGSGGKVLTDFFGFTDSAAAVAIQPDTNIVVAGTALNLSISNDFALARYKGDGILPPEFNICLQDDKTGQILQFNATTGDYQFLDCRKGITLTGRGTVSIRFCKIELQDVEHGHNVVALANTCTHAGTASVKVFSPNRTFTISDKDITNNTCSCR